MRRRYWIVSGIAVVAVAAAGGAVAATKFETPTQRSNAIIADAAGRLNIAPGALSSALQKALDDQIDADVAAGRLTQAQGDALKAKVDAGSVPLVGGLGGGFGRGFGFGHGFGMFRAGLGTVTSFLGITADQLRTELQSGRSLAQIAQEHGKTADDLVSALVAAAKTRLDQAVKDGRLSSDQETTMLGKLQTAIQNLVNRTPPTGWGSQNGPRQGFGFGFGFHFGGRHEFGGAPPSSVTPSTPSTHISYAPSPL